MSVSENSTTCFSNIIALDGTCSPTPPSSGIYASDIGITKYYLSQILTQDYVNEQDLFTKKLNLAIQTITNQIHGFFQPKYKAVSVVENLRTGFPQENKTVISGYAGYKGQFFDLYSERSYVDFFASEFSLFLNYTGTVNIKVFDLLQAKILDSFNVSTIAGEICTIYPHEKFTAAKRRLQLFIAYDATGIDSYYTLLKNSPCTNCSGELFKNSYCTIGAYKLPTGADAIRSNLIGSSDTGGLSVVHSLQCNHREWLCSISNLLAYPILYKTAALIHEFALTESPNVRINTTDTLNQDLIKERMNSAEFKYREWMDNTLKSLQPPNDEYCFKCQSNVRHSIVLP